MRTIVLVGAAALLAQAAGTRSWDHASEADFKKAKMKNLALRSDGRVSLAPALSELYDASTNYLWAVAEDSKGNVWAGGGGQDNKARLVRVDAAGKGSLVAELAGLEVHALAIDSADRVYAATSPDGKVYRLDASGKPEVFYDPKAKYIWALAFNKQGDLFVATGDKGEIHKVSPNGTGAVFFKTEESHARSMAVDGEGNVYVGTEPGGLILRVTPAGLGFVVYQSSKPEVTALALSPQGHLYAAAIGTKQSPVAPPAPAQQPAPQAAAPGARPPATAVPTVAPAIQGGSEVYRIEADGYPRKLWSDPSEIVYAIAFDAQGRAVLGTGNKGAIYRLDSDLLSTLLVNATPTQVTGLAAGRAGRILAVTGNIGKVFQLGPGLEKQGTLESESLDSGFFTFWGRLDASQRGPGGRVNIETRSGNLTTPQKNWSPWAPVPLNSSGGRIASPAARFLQYRLTLSAAADGKSPEISSVSVAYLPKNVAPVVEVIDLTPANYRFAAQTLTLSTATSQTLSLPALTRTSRPAVTPLTPSDSPSGTMNHAKGFVGARWLARDDNGDRLVSKVEIRGISETAWKLLKDDLRERNFAWDSTAFADGEYLLRVTVNDSPGNAPDQALSGSLESDAFVVDNTPPAISGLAATRNGSRVEVKWRASDALTVLSRAEYSVNGGEWKVAEPTTKLTDSLEHDYQVVLDLPAGEHTIAVRVQDDYENPAAAKTVVK